MKQKKNSISGFIILLMIMSVILAAIPLPVLAAQSCDTTYSVKQGDTLKKIGDKFGVTPYRIVNFNNMDTPYTLWVGAKLCIPDKPKYEKAQPKLSNKYANQGAADFTVLRSGDGEILVRVVNYKANTVFLVKADDASDEARDFVKLGTLNPARGKEFHFSLPKDLRKGTALWVCMKDQTTDLKICRYLHAMR